MFDLSPGLYNLRVIVEGGGLEWLLKGGASQTQSPVTERRRFGSEGAALLVFLFAAFLRTSKGRTLHSPHRAGQFYQTFRTSLQTLSYLYIYLFSFLQTLPHCVIKR